MSDHGDRTDALTRPATLVADWDNLPDHFADWHPGQAIGPFRLKRPLGQGGMGVVWLAEQLEPLQREVAIKVMLPASRSRLAEARFEVERQALAQLSHRAIAQIFDAGRLPGGGLFFAMEYVPGAPLDQFLHEHRLSLPALIELLIEVCHGVQHAHQRGLIHRDIKPLNILVSEVDGLAQPKLIDFGVAISEGADAHDPKARYYRAGTRAYMAPEQIEPEQSGVDLRADIYALGAVLAECLQRLADPQAAVEHGFDSTAARLDLERSLGARSLTSEPNGKAGQSSLKHFPAELRAIALKAMATDRDQRYDSAVALADDLRRWLRREPVAALGDGRWYRARCFLRRHALASAAAAVVALALVAGLTMALYGMNQARLERIEAEQARALAEQRRNDAEELIQFMLGDFATRLRPLGRLDLLDEIGSEALAYLTARSGTDDPESALSRARALRTLGEVQSSRQQFEQARQTLTEAAALLEPWSDRIEPELAELHFEAGQIAFWRGHISYRQRDFDRTETHWQAYRRAAEAFAATTDDRQRARQERGYAYSNLGTLAEARNDWSAALENFQRVAEYRRELLDPDDIDTVLSLANTLSWMSRVRNAIGQPVAAWNDANQALELVLAQRDRAPEHARRRRLEINFRLILAHQAMFLDRPEKAAEQLREAVALAEEDVAVDPTQPRRQAQLARLAFFSAGLSADRPDRPEQAAAMLMLELGASARRAAEELGLDPQQQVELPARHALARLQVGDITAEARAFARASFDEVVETLAGREVFDAHFFALAELAVDLAARLDHREAVDLTAALHRIEQRLNAVPERQRNAIRYLLIRADLARLGQPDEEELFVLEQRISAMRAQVGSALD
ncbi:MAG: serine/threonine-protein kinase [Wenzhouxiangella sp.]|nr:serine/threonine-protein kinase [Wenzhouxiangella sp.]